MLHGCMPKLKSSVHQSIIRIHKGRNRNMYKMKRAKIFIYNVYFFRGGNREGSDKDVPALWRTFKGMNADNEIEELSDDKLEHIIQPKPIRVRPADGLSDKQRLEKKIKTRIIEQDFSAFDYVVFVVMSHGTEDGVIGLYDGYCLLEETFLKPLIQNSSLARKLKWIISPCCRGKIVDATENFSGAEVELPHYNFLYYLVSYATPEGSVSRRRGTGSVFIQALCSVLESIRPTKDILSILLEEVPKELNNNMPLMRTKSGKILKNIQTPTVSTNLYSDQFFFFNNYTPRATYEDEIHSTPRNNNEDEIQCTLF